MAPRVAHVQLQPLKYASLSKSARAVGRITCRCHGNDFGPPHEFAKHVLEHHLTKDSKFSQDFESAISAKQKVCFRVQWPMAQFVLRAEKKDIELAQLHFHVHAVRASANMEVKSYSLDGDSIRKRMIQRATADVAGQRVQLVMADGAKTGSLLVQFGECKNGTSTSKPKLK